MKAMVERFLRSWVTSTRLRSYLLPASALLFAACTQLPSRPPQENTVAEANKVSSVATTEPEASVATAAAGTVATMPAPAVAEQGIQDAAVTSPAQTMVAAELPPAAPAEPAVPALISQSPQRAEQTAVVNALCAEVGNKLGSVSAADCQKHGFRDGLGKSVNGRPLVVKDLLPGTSAAPDFRVLIMGGIHGDEYSSISILFKWLDLYSARELEGEFLWRFAPLVNPDGLLDGGKASRQNANGVDLNRNFPSRDWNDSAVSYWRKSTGSNPRRYPGEQAASEPEVQWLVQQIKEFQPHVIVSVHAPYHLLDFDGPAAAPEKIGELQLRQLGVYPGSLGNYAGLNQLIPVVTLELPSAGSLPAPDQIDLMWHDLVAWLDREGRKNLLD